MTSTDEKEVAPKCPVPSKTSMPGGADYAWSIFERKGPNIEVNSATVYLLKKAASAIPRLANLLWGMIQDSGWDKNIVRIVEGMDAYALADLGLASNALLSSALSPYLLSMSKASQSIKDSGDDRARDSCAKENEAPLITSDAPDSSPCEQNAEMSEGGLIIPDAELDDSGRNERLDYVITQGDISRMARAASRHLNVENIHQLPTTIYRAKNPLICSRHEGENVDDFLLRNAKIIEDYFDNTEESTERECQGEDPKTGPSPFSWMVVPKDPKRDEMTRIASSIRTGEVPDSISIDKCTESLEMEYNGHHDKSFDVCVICEKPFADGECLRILPCQHLFHCGCIDKWPLEAEMPSNQTVMSGCPMCKKISLETPPQGVATDSYAEEPQGESYHTDGTVPSWAFTRLGSLLSNHE